MKEECSDSIAIMVNGKQIEIFLEKMTESCVLVKAAEEGFPGFDYGVVAISAEGLAVFPNVGLDGLSKDEDQRLIVNKVGDKGANR